MEIERKFLINELPEYFDSYQKLEIQQGYLNKKPTLRIRKSNDTYYLTYKSDKTAENESNNKFDALINEEIEMPIDEKTFSHLAAKIDNNMIFKTRTIVPLGAYYNPDDKAYLLHAEVDEFHGKLEGLRFAEVEFPSVEASNRFPKPKWFGEEVSKDKRYRNGFLSEQNDLSSFK